MHSDITMDDVRKHANEPTRCLLECLQRHAGDPEAQMQEIVHLFGGGRMSISAPTTIRRERAKEKARRLFEGGADLRDVARAVDGISDRSLRRVMNDVR